MTTPDATQLFYTDTGLDPDRTAAQVAKALNGCDDGELYLQYAVSESFAFDDGRLKSASFDTMKEHRLADERFRRINVEMTPHQRLGTVDDVAATVAFLCSPGGAFINGQTIVVDGGWSATKYLSERALNSEWTI